MNFFSLFSILQNENLGSVDNIILEKDISYIDLARTESVAPVNKCMNQTTETCKLATDQLTGEIHMTLKGGAG